MTPHPPNTHTLEETGLILSIEPSKTYPDPRPTSCRGPHGQSSGHIKLTLTVTKCLGTPEEEEVERMDHFWSQHGDRSQAELGRGR